MNQSRSLKAVVTTVVSVGALCASAGLAEAGAYDQTNLVSNIAGLAGFTDPALINPWGMSFSSSSPIWISNQGTSTATLYSVTSGFDVTKIIALNPPTGNIGIPTTSSGPQGPTGQVFNGTSSFGGAAFIFANLNGTISAWSGGTSAVIQSPATTPGATFSGLAINQAKTMLYAANDAGSGSIDVFNSSFAPTTAPGGFIDPDLPAGLVPFNVEDIGSKVYVTYAPAGRTDQQNATAGMGVIDVYDESGDFLNRLVTGSALAAPWGVALAPATGFGSLSGDLLVGNFSFVDSGINAFDPTTGAWEGSIAINPGAGDTPGGLWSLAFGNGGSGGSPDILYFNDGINGETAGLFGAISVPEPSTWAMMFIGFGGLALLAARRRRGVSWTLGGARVS